MNPTPPIPASTDPTGVALVSGEAPDGDDEPPSASTHAGDSMDLNVDAGDLVIVVQWEVPAPPAGWLDRSWLGVLGQVASRLGFTRGEVVVALVGDARMAALHQQYAGEPGTTDVLTFDHRGDRAPHANTPTDTPAEGWLLADIAVCVDEAARQAESRRHGPREESLLYAVHGLLHLAGYDDHDDVQAETMHKLEDALLAEAGVGPVFGLSGKPSSVAPDPAGGRQGESSTASSRNGFSPSGQRV